MNFFNLMRRLKKTEVKNITDKRVIIIHNHLFKNAGSTLDWSLQRNFTKGFIDHRDDQNMKIGADYLGPYLMANKQIQAISTHHLHFPLPVLNDVELLLMTLYRHPIKRVLSVYFYEKKQLNSNTLGARFARSHSLKEYVEWRLSPETPPTIKNFQTRKTLPVSLANNEKLNFPHLQEAINQVNQMALVGIVEDFDKSIVLFEDCLKKYFQSIDLSYIPQNVNNKNTLKDDYENYLLDELGQSIFTRLFEENELDIELYNYSRELVNKRFNSLENGEMKLVELKQRCSSH